MGQAWGTNVSYQLGSQAPSPANTARLVSPPAAISIKAIGSSGNVGYAITNAGYLLSWGSNVNSRAGRPATDNVPYTANYSLGVLPGYVVSSTGSAPAHVTQVSGGRENSYALSSDGTVTSWGGPGPARGRDGGDSLLGSVVFPHADLRISTIGAGSADGYAIGSCTGTAAACAGEL
jgi:alpha-tubulin suppressor-like RCC1 family protein